jgi:CheY-like chemotaxis protein
MPGMSGGETARGIKSLEGCGQIPIIAFTASLSTNEPLLEYFSGQLSKPIEENELFQELKKFLPYSDI